MSHLSNVKALACDLEERTKGVVEVVYGKDASLETILHRRAPLPMPGWFWRDVRGAADKIGKES